MKLITIKSFKDRLLKKKFKQNKNNLFFFFHLNDDLSLIVKFINIKNELYLELSLKNTQGASNVDSYLLNYIQSDMDALLRDLINISKYSIKEFDILIDGAINKFKNETIKDVAKVANARRKKFINFFDSELSKLEFIKTGNIWNKTVSKRYNLSFELVKTIFNDTYSAIFKLTPVEFELYNCFFLKLKVGDVDLIDYQTVDYDALLASLNLVINNYLLVMISSKISDLGKMRFMVDNSSCDHKRCKRCFVKAESINDR